MKMTRQFEMMIAKSINKLPINLRKWRKYIEN